ncbi:MAG: FHA domain-containing protein [Deltaproteobacteria bacterium]|nr:FHA domain-containing protein [Deltaproteobacteria bacterium]
MPTSVGAVKIAVGSSLEQVECEPEVTARMRVSLPIGGERPALARRALATPVVPFALRDPRTHVAALMVLCGPDPGRVIRLHDDERVIGRDPNVDVPVADTTLSRRHASIAKQPGGTHLLRDLGSTNGTFIGMRRVEQATLRNGDRVQLGPNVVFRFLVADSAELLEHQRLAGASTFDAVTGALDRASFCARVDAVAERADRDIAIVALRLDAVEHVDQADGRASAEALLRSAAVYLVQAIRTDDVFGKGGGDQLAVALTSGGPADALAVAERLRIGIAALPTRTPLEASVGIAWLSESRSAGAALRRADVRAQAASRAGGNRVIAAD